MNITNIKGIGEKTAALFSKLNIEDTQDLLRYYPRDYDYFENPQKIYDLTPGIRSIEAKCLANATSKYVNGKSIVTCRVGDDSGSIVVVYFNMPFVKNALKAGEVHVFRGNVIRRGDSYILNQPKMYSPQDYRTLANRYHPIYSTTKGLSTKAIQKAVKSAYEVELSDLHNDANILVECLPEHILSTRNLMPIREAVLNMHMPLDFDTLIEARRRIAYQEFFDFILNIEKGRNKTLRTNNYPMIQTADTVRFVEGIPFKLTEDQNKVWDEIQNDMCSEHGLCRLVQGDVGSGKTIIAILALLLAVSNGYQGALMAPTEVLASQHLDTINKLTESLKLPFKPAFLTGSVKGKARKEMLEAISSGEANVIIGTHALFQEAVEYNKLALVITDEQHRFGVLQRESLMLKGGKPHVLIMSATPIPRTLAMILYGDLDVSAIHTMPKGRLPIKNCVVDTAFRPKAYEFAVNEVKKGHQVYIICPSVEESDIPGLTNVVDYTKELKSELPDNIRIEYLHGKMKQTAKDKIMENMALGNIDILVSTTVIEVGVNVPNATLMYVENAERFGLAQLHQLRGRVGRSDVQSYCIFMMGNSSEKAKQRLHILEKSNDGFEIASKDMKLRGPGDIFGIRQSGEMSFTIGDIYQDADLITMAAEDVKDFLKKD